MVMLCALQAQSYPVPHIFSMVASPQPALFLSFALTGATMYQCGMACKSAGAASVSAFLAHAVFPNHSWRSFLPDGAHYGCFERFFVTNSVPSVTDVLPQGSVFEVLDLSGKIVEDLDRYS
jgi:phosphoribosylpyrophosphate synthetase